MQDNTMSMSIRNQHCGRRDEGAVTAEVAVALPAVILVVSAVLVVVMAGLAHLRVADAARAGARAASAGESESSIVDVVRHLAGDEATVRVSWADPWVTVSVSTPVAGGWVIDSFAATSTAQAWVEPTLTQQQTGDTP
jgi:Flp pilus assembly protein TadG